MSYELFYSSGGHCGPYWTLRSAIDAGRARLKGCPITTSITIKERTASGVGGYGQTVMVLRQVDDAPQPNQMAY